MILGRYALLALCLALGLNGCNWHKNYQQDLRQGQWLHSKQIERLKLGMSQQEVAHIMGSPVKATLNNQRWSYVQYHSIKGHMQINRHITLFFEADGRLAKIGKPKDVSVEQS